MKRLLKGGRVVDPANGIDGAYDVLIEDGRIARVEREPAGARRRCAGRRGGRGSGARAPASSTCTCTCASRARSTRKRSPPARGRPSPAGSPPSRACRTRRPSTTTPAIDGVDPEEGRGGGPRARLSDRRRVARLERRAPGRHRGAARGRLRRHLRRRPAGGDGAADAPGARVRVDVRHAGHRPLRGPVAQGRTASRTKASTRRSLGLRGLPGAAETIMVQRDVTLAGLTGGRVHIAHMSARGSLRAVRDGKAQGFNVTCEVAPHHFVLTDEALDRPDSVRHELQDEPAAARAGRRRRDARGPRRRQRRRHRHRPRAASRRREGRRVRPRALRHRRPRDVRAAGVRSARAPGPHHASPAPSSCCR